MPEPWPTLPLAEWRDTYATLHMWTQIVGKVRLAQTPWINHSWHVTLYVTARGLTTSPIPHGSRSFEIEFDFLAHELSVQRNDGARRTLALTPRPVADFYAQLMTTLRELDLPVHISAKPNEVDPAIPFAQDRTHASYDPDYANRCWQIFAQTERVMKTFRSRFIGKCSPIHFFWGAFDLAVTRFSGRRAPQHPGGIPNFPDWVAREAYSHEVSSCGFWPGSGSVAMPAYYAYVYPQPPGFSDAAVLPRQAAYKKDLGEFILPYDAVRSAADPDQMLLSFFESTYAAAADLAHWDRASLERDSGDPAATRPDRH